MVADITGEASNGVPSNALLILGFKYMCLYFVNATANCLYPGGGHGNPLQYSCLGCLENPRDVGTGNAAVQRVAKSLTGVKQLSSRARTVFSALCSMLWCGVNEEGDKRGKMRGFALDHGHSLS